MAQIMKREKKLLENSLLFAIGGIGGKFLQFVLLPFYTYMLTSAQYGEIDILQNIAALVMPIVSLSITEGVFRYAMEKNTDKKLIFSIGVVVLGIGAISTFFLLLILNSIFMVPYSFLIWVYIFSSLFFNLFSQFVKAMEKNRLYVLSSILQTVLICIFSIIFLHLFYAGIEGYFGAYIASNMICALTVFCSEKLWRYLHFEVFVLKHPLTRKTLQFCIPLIPNSICWWVINFADRIMIESMYGYSANGLYAIAHKFPTIIVALMNMFFSAWQISANQEYEEKDTAHFFSKIYSLLQSGMVSLVAIIIPFSKILCSFLFSKAYFDAWIYIPIMLVGIIAFTLSQFLGSIYSAAKRTKMAFVTNLIAAVLNVALNFVLLIKIGVYGAAVATTVSFFVQWLIRVQNIRSFFPLSAFWKKTACNFCLLLLEVTATTLTTGMISIASIVLMLLLLAINACPLVAFVVQRSNT